MTPAQKVAKWRSANPKKKAAHDRSYRERNKKKLGAYSVEWRRANPQAWIHIRAKSLAKKRGIEFTIQPEDVVLVDRCPILNIALSYTNSKRAGNSASIDRVDNTRGYVPGNVRIISFRANSMKGDFTLEDIERLYFYSRGIL